MPPATATAALPRRLTHTTPPSAPSWKAPTPAPAASPTGHEPYCPPPPPLLHIPSIRRRRRRGVRYWWLPTPTRGAARTGRCVRADRQWFGCCDLHCLTSLAGEQDTHTGTYTHTLSHTHTGRPPPGRLHRPTTNTSRRIAAATGPSSIIVGYRCPRRPFVHALGIAAMAGERPGVGAGADSHRW